jgi:osmotically-inducible protein OsmY
MRRVAITTAIAIPLLLLAGCNRSSETTAAAGLTDSDLERSIKAQISTDPKFQGIDIDVDADADENKVTLTGDVPSEEMRARAVDLAKQAHPGITVTDKIDVKPGEVSRSANTEEQGRTPRDRARTAGDKICI